MVWALSFSFSLVGCVADMDNGAPGSPCGKVAATVLRGSDLERASGGPGSAAPTPAASTLGALGAGGGLL